MVLILSVIQSTSKGAEANTNVFIKLTHTKTPHLNAAPISLSQPSRPRAMPGAHGTEIPKEQAIEFQGHQNANTL